MDWTVRKATVHDAERVATINVESWRSAYRGILTDEYLGAIRPGDRVDRIRQRLVAPPPAALLLAVDGDGRVGAYAGLAKARDAADHHAHLPTGELASLYADPVVQGTGAGYAAHQAGVEFLAEQGFKHAIVWVFEKNAPSRRFYEARGWTSDDVTKDGVFGGARFSELRYSRSLV